jgi:hypothetical protein
MMPAMSGGRGVDSTFVRSVDVLAPGAARHSGQAHELRLE